MRALSQTRWAADSVRRLATSLVGEPELLEGSNDPGWVGRHGKLTEHLRARDWIGMQLVTARLRRPRLMRAGLAVGALALLLSGCGYENISIDYSGAAPLRNAEVGACATLASTVLSAPTDQHIRIENVQQRVDGDVATYEVTGTTQDRKNPELSEAWTCESVLDLAKQTVSARIVESR